MNIFNKIIFFKASLITKATRVLRVRKLSSLTIVLVSCVWSQLAFGSALSDLANSMQPGTWAKLNTNNPNIIIKPNGGDILEYSNRGAWDPANRKLYFCGASHHGSFLSDCVVYDDATNAWSSIGLMPGVAPDTYLPPTTHGYDHNAFDTTRGHFYFRGYNSGTVWRYDTGVGTWSTIAPIPFNSGQGNVCLSITGILEYFPDIDRLVFLNSRCSGDAFYYNPATNSWSVPQTPINALGDGDYSTTGAYSNQGFIYGGCGVSTNQIWRLNKSQTWQQMSTSPIPCVITSSLGVADPASGNLLLFGATVYELNAQTNTWINTGTASKYNPNSDSAIIVPISNHGVVMLVKTITSQTQTEVWLYKHATSTSITGTPPPPSDTSAPSSPGTLTAAPASSSQINLSWTASTDNVGVTAYLLERCQGSACTNFIQISAPTPVSYSDTGVTANTDYRYRVRARDGAGNLSSYSTIVSTTTPSSSSPVIGGSDFTTRCSQPGVIKCVGFDSAADLGGKGWGNRVGYDTQDGSACNSGSGSTQRRCPTIDTTVKASGTGSAKFDVPVGAPGSLAGAWWANFTDDLSLQYGGSGNFTYYVQLRMRYTPSFINAGNWKAHWVTTAGDKPGCSASSTTNCQSSCTDIELVVQTNSPNWGFPSVYSGCPGAFSMTIDNTLSGGGDFNLQNARPSPYCLYSQVVGGKQFPPTGNCFPYVADEWMTYSYKIQMGPRGTSGEGNCKGSNNFTNCYYNNDIQMRMGREGQPTQPVITWTGGINAGTIASDLKYGKIWIMPYSGSATFATGGTMWVDEVIISRQPIADPGTSQSAQAPAAPTGLTIK